VIFQKKMKEFKEYKQLNLPEMSHEVLAEWEKEDLFRQSITTREGHKPFYFFEGPPSANGMPGIHHVLARTIKDTFCRFKTMQGYQVHRKAGWDTHGLPVELGVEKMLGITKEDIGKKISVDEYNAACRREVMKYTKEWTNLTRQMGYWVDLEHPYITYDNKYIETLWFLLKQLYQKGYLYKGYTIQPYSPAAGTGLSSHELNQPGCYRDVKDTTCTAKFRLTSDSVSGLTSNSASGLTTYIIAWTTTPWTLPSNTALCVGPKIDYVAVRLENEVIILAEARMAAYAKELGENPEIIWRGKGTDLVGLEYEQLIDWADPGEGAFRVIAGDYVTTEDGTGIVHIAPTFGADDAFVAGKAGVPGMLFLTKKGEKRPMVDMAGKLFKTEDLDPQFVAKHIRPSYEPWQGRFVKNAYAPNLTDKDETLDLSICLMLKQAGKVFRIE
jgi:isoleucyl-tRNA synthetase